jgi:hypothetical protein
VPVVDQHFCTACGHQLGSGDLFCTACGVRVTPPGSLAAPETPAEPAPEPVTEPSAETTAVRRPSVLDQMMTSPDDTVVRRAVPPARTRRPKRSRRRFWAGVAAAAVVVAGVSYGLGTIADRGGDHHDDRAGQPTTGASSGAAGSDTSAPTPSSSPLDPQALAQARALHTLIDHSAADKQRIAAAAAQLQGCRHPKQAIQTFEDAASSRDRLVDQAADLQVGLLPGGGAAVASFSQALRASADADRAYVAWGQARHKVRRHHHVLCRGGKSLQRTAVQLSSASHAAKQRTAQEWNVIAAQFGLPRITWTNL